MPPSLKSRMAAFQQAAAPEDMPTKKNAPVPRRSSKNVAIPSSFTSSSSSPAQKVPAQKVVVPRGSSKNSIASRSSAFTSSTPKLVNKSIASRSSAPTKNAPKKTNESVCSRYTPNTKKKVSPAAQKPKPKPLSAQQRNVLLSVSSPTASSSSSKLSSCKKPPKVDVTQGGYATPTSQSQAHRSDKAKVAAVAPKELKEKDADWDYLYELALRYDLYKLQEVEETKANGSQLNANSDYETQRHEQGDKTNIKNALEGIMGGTNFTANGKFLTNDFIDQYLVENNTTTQSLTFDFSGQTKLFQFFHRKNEEQRQIAAMFVQALLNHPRSTDITALTFANSFLPDCFLQALTNHRKACLPKLQVLNLESNLLGQEGIVALSNCIADASWRYLQVIKLENQKMPLTSDAEEALGNAILQSPSLVVVSLRVRGGLERQQINNTVQQNIDNLRLARRKHAEKNGSFKERSKRNEMEQFFDKIAANDTDISEVNLVGNIKFLGLNPTERIKAAASFGTNNQVKKITMCHLKLDDVFCKTFGEALAANVTLEKVVLDSNAFSGTGLKALLQGLDKNTSISEFQVRHQSKATSSADEEVLPELLTDNNTIIKLGIDLRNQMARMQLDRKLNANREYQRKQRAAMKKKA